MAIASQPRHWRVFAPLAAVLVLFALWSGYWWWGSGEALRRVAAVRADLERQGLDVSCGSESVGGYPFRFSFTCTRVGIAAVDGSRAGAGQIEALAQAWDPGHLIFLIEGPLRLARRDGGVWTISHAPAVASLVMRRAGAQASFLAEGVTASGPVGERLAAARLNMHLRLPEAKPAEGSTGAATDLALFANGLEVSTAGGRGFTIDRLEAEASLTGLSPPLPETLSAALRAAAAAGAELRLQRLVASTGGVDADASGSVRLLETGLPAGRIAIHLGDVKLLFQRLVEHGMMAKKAASGAAVLVDLLTAANGAGGKPGSVDLVFKDGSVFWGPFRLATHGPLF